MTRFLFLAAIVVFSSVASAASCPNPWKPGTKIDYDPVREVLVHRTGVGVMRRDKRKDELLYRSDDPSPVACRLYYGDENKAGRCQCFQERYAAEQADLREREASARAAAERQRREREDTESILRSTPSEPSLNLSSAGRQALRERMDAVNALLDEIRSLEAQNRMAEADAKRQELISKYMFPPSGTSAQPQQGRSDPQAVAGSPAAAQVTAPAIPRRVYVQLPDDGSFRLTGGPPTEACSAFVANVNVRPRIEQALRNAAPNVQIAPTGTDAPRIKVDHFSWECFRKYPDWGTTVRLSLSANPASGGAGTVVSGERTIFRPTASECFTIECAAQKFHAGFNPLVEELAAELTTKLVAQIPPSTSPEGLAATTPPPAPGPVGSAPGSPIARPGGGVARAEAPGQGERVVNIPISYEHCGSWENRVCVSETFKQAEGECYRLGGKFSMGDGRMTSFGAYGNIVCRVPGS